MSFGVIDSIFDAAQISRLIEICHEFRDTTGYFLRRRDPLCAELKSMVLPAINRIEPGDHYYKSMFLDINRPGTPHVDEYYDKDARNTYIIPLNIELMDPQKPGHTSTLIFNQFFYSEYQPSDDRYDIEPFFKTAPDSSGHYQAMSVDDINFFKRTLGPNADQKIKKLSVAAVLPWKIGSMLYFARNQIHCSNDMHRTNVRKKQALVVFTTNDLISDELW